MRIPDRQSATVEEQIAAWRENIPDLFHGSYRRAYDKAMSGKSLRAAIDSKCLDCVCWEQVEVKKCTAVTCPLHPYRPYRADSTQQQACGAADTEGTPVVGLIEGVQNA